MKIRNSVVLGLLGGCMALSLIGCGEKAKTGADPTTTKISIVSVDAGKNLIRVTIEEQGKPPIVVEGVNEQGLLNRPASLGGRSEEVRKAESEFFKKRDPREGKVYEKY